MAKYSINNNHNHNHNNNNNNKQCSLVILVNRFISMNNFS